MPEPAPIVDAATILLLRDGSDGLEVFMVVRHHQIDFASGALVFPGGKVDPSDSDPELQKRLEGAVPGRETFQVAAIREAFEECGVLLARPEGSSTLVAGQRLQDMEEIRLAMAKGDYPFLNFLQEQQLNLAGDLLVPFAHWITPEMMPKRFDTHFYLAVAPSDQLAIHDGEESVDSVWIRPQDAVAEAHAGTKTVIFPTLRNVDMLAEATTTSEAMTQASQRKIVSVLPWTEKRADGMWLCIPQEAGYEVFEEKMPDRPTR